MKVRVDEDLEAFRLTRTIRIARRIEGKERISEETHQVMTFDPREVEKWLRQAGFSVRVHRRYGMTKLLPRRLAFEAIKRTR
jgi:hypothetical protein